MNTPVKNRRALSAGPLLLTLAVAAPAAQARPTDPSWAGPPQSAKSTHAEDARVWRFVARGPLGTYKPVEGARGLPMQTRSDVVERWVRPRSTVPLFRHG